MTSYLTTENLLALVADLGVGPVRDIGLLDSAAHRPGVVVLGEEAYPTIHLKAAVLLESILRNHALVDGNKRLGWLAPVVFYGLNGWIVDAPDDPAYDLVVGVAMGEVDPGEAADLLAQWIRPA